MARRSIRTFTGSKAPETCPWRAYQDPDVMAVLALYSECRTDNGCTPALLQWDPPGPHWDGMIHYRQCIELSKQKHREMETANG